MSPGPEDTEPAKPAKAQGKPVRDLTRDERRKAALKANMARRKAQARARAGGGAGQAVGDGDNETE
ncbi:MAG: hypothetical protein RIT14_2955 [Pseudomonadota bacterium]